MTATITIAGLDRPVTVHDDTVVRVVADAVAVYIQRGVDSTVRIPRPSPSRHVRRVLAVKASEVLAVDANGILLADPIRREVAA